MNATICDRCSEVMRFTDSLKKYNLMTAKYSHDNGAVIRDPEHRRDIDLCASCFELFEAWMWPDRE